jgi:predicted Zn-dependent protease
MWNAEIETPSVRRRRMAFWALLLVGSCAINPATGTRQLNFISKEQEIELGADAAKEIARSPGLYADRKLQAYVASVGSKLAAVSERPDLPWSFQVVDDAGINAFALPGGPIFVTRGLLAHLENEAQLAIVLGHEVGHVTAEHAANQLSKASLAQLGLAPVAMISEGVAGAGMAGMELLFLKFGRDDERQSDMLALRYAQRAGYDVRVAPAVFEMLRRASSASDGGRLPGWLATHPDPGARVEDMRERLADLDASRRAGRVDEASLMAALDGMTYGEDPREGFVQGRRFIHPELRFQVEFPSGYRIVNGKERVVAMPEAQGELAIEMTLADRASSEGALQAFFSETGARPERAPERMGKALAAPFTVRSEDDALRGWVAFLRDESRTYRFLLLAREGTAPKSVLSDVVTSFRRLAPDAYRNARPKRLAVQKLPAPRSVRELHSAHPNVSVEELSLINQTQENAVLPQGSLVKVVSGPS